MGAAIDTVGLSYLSPTTATAGYAAMAPIGGGSTTVRSFAQPDRANLVDIMYQATTINALRVRSPLLHDNTQGIRILPPESPVEFSLPDDWAQPLRPQDNLVVEVNDQTANAGYAAALLIYYANLPGAAARLHMPGDVLPNGLNLKPVEVVITPVARAWTDALLTSTENLLKANTDYAVLGFMVNNPVAAVGLYGSDTSNLRICGPGVARTDETAYWFADLAESLGMPCIPVINAANASGTNVSVLSTLTTAVTVTLMLLQLGGGSY